MKLEEFLTVFKLIINEFRILNEHFDSHAKSTTAEYDMIFFRWAKDMSRRYNGIPIRMHWGTSSRAIEKNQILFNILYKDDYFSEVKYCFNKSFVIEFQYSIKDAVLMLENIIKAFNLFNSLYDKNEYGEVADYDRAFNDWKKKGLNISPDIAVDIHWGNKEKDLLDNFFFLTVMFKDNYTFQMKYY